MPAVCLTHAFGLDALMGILLVDFLRYLLPAATLAGLLVLLPADWVARRRVRTREPAAGQPRREFLFSMSTVLIFSVVGALMVAGVQAGLLRMYQDVADHGWPYLVASLAALIVLHDAWFYWTHRLLHKRWMFRWAHRTHHQSVAPTPWAAYSFAPAEAVVQAVFLPLVLTVLPLHPSVVGIFLLHMIVRNVLGHAGVDLMPRAWLAGWWGRWLTTTLHHDMHHADGRFNRALYFTWWDRLCGTEHPEYRKKLAEWLRRVGA
jgi:lathosterol oxidase